MKLTITVLSDNHAGPGLEVEHGFALWIEISGRRILFDTGAGEAFWHNVAALGVDIAQTDTIVLSHGHYDHTGNLCRVLEQAPRAKLYGHPDSTIARYSIRETPKPIRMPLSAAVAVTAMPRLKRHAVTRPMALAANVWLTGPVPRLTEFEDVGGPFFLDKQGETPDEISDDLSLWIKTKAGLVICFGCCHSGLINTLRYIVKVSGTSRIAAILGGVHLVNASSERLERTVEALAAYQIPMIAPCHCTGDAAAAFLAERLGPAVQPGAAGMKWNFE